MNWPGGRERCSRLPLMSPRQKASPGVCSGLLWPGSDPAHAQGNLRFCIIRSRKRYQASSFSFDRQPIDLAEPRKFAIGRQPFRGARAGWHADGTYGSLRSLQRRLPGNRDETSLEYEEWLLPERERLREIARSAYWQLFSLRLWRGELTEARQCAERFLAIRPLLRTHDRGADPPADQAGRPPPRQPSMDESGHFSRMISKSALDRKSRISVVHWEKRGPTTINPDRADPFQCGLGAGAATPFPTAKPLVAVLPFRDYSDQPIASLSAALTEDVISDLARFRRLSVLARHTSFSLLSHSDAEARLRQLGARYSVEGSIRHNGNSLNVTVRLVDNRPCVTSGLSAFKVVWTSCRRFRTRSRRALLR